MNQTLHRADTSLAPPARRLDAYQAALEFSRAVETSTGAWPRGWADLRDQTRRAAQSVLLNLADGVGQYRRGAKYRHYQFALGSTNEVIAALDPAEGCQLFSTEPLGRLCGGRASGPAMRRPGEVATASLDQTRRGPRAAPRDCPDSDASDDPFSR